MNKVNKNSLKFLGILLIFVIFVLWILSPILPPFVVGLSIAYFLDPLVDFLEEKKINRGLATTLILIIFFMVFSLVFFLILPIIMNQFFEFLKNSPDLINRFQIFLDNTFEFIEISLEDYQINEMVSKLDFDSVSTLAELTAYILSSSMAILNTLGVIIITPVVSWYFLKDWDVIVAKINSLIPKKYTKEFNEITFDIDNVLSSFVRGQLTICLFMSIFYGIGLTVLGLKYSLIIGCFVGLISFIPYFGATFGFTISVILGLLEFNNTLFIGYIFLVFAVGQLLEGYILTPKLIGNKLGLHPVVIIFSILAGGSTFGLIGIFLSIPTLSIVIILAKKYLFNYNLE